MFTDTHCHIDDEKLQDKKGVYDRIVKENISFAINMGCDLKSCYNGLLLSKEYEKVYFGAGIHPEFCADYNESTVKEIKELSKNEKCVAIGEIGLDYHYEPFDKIKQKETFINQIELANELNLPISVHSRDACLDTLTILKEHKPKKSGVLHCFSGSVETAKEYLNLGLYISFGGTLTFKNAKNLLDVAKFVPIEYCLTETDSPYLSPEPFRGGVNEPSNVRFVCMKLAEIKGLTVHETAYTLRENAKKLFYKIK